MENQRSDIVGMMTLKQFISGLDTIPVTTSWYLADIGEAKGRQGLYTKQSPQRLKSLKEHALIESAVSSNRIEGVEVEKKRIGTVIFGKSLLHDRSEEEIRGYREALNLIHDSGVKLSLTEDTCQKLHRLIRGEIWDAGKYKEKDSDIIKKRQDGTSSIRFRTVPADKTSVYMKGLMPYSRHGRLLLQQRHVPGSTTPGVEKTGGHIQAQGLQDACRQTKDLTRNDRHALNMAAFRIPCLLRKPHSAERRQRDGEPGAVHHPGILLPGADAVSR